VVVHAKAWRAGQSILSPVTLAARLLALDEAGARALNGWTRRTRGGQHVARTAAGWLAGAEVLLMGQLVVRGHWQTALRMLCAVGGIYIMSELLGLLLARQRPFAEDAQVEELLSHHPARSFPSRHVASAVAMALLARTSDVGVARAMATCAVLLGVSRVAAGLHYPSDVAAGAVLGVIASRYGRRP
jgi:membrane-associated phospholipid phosphatase